MTIVGTTVLSKLRVLIHCAIRFHKLVVWSYSSIEGSKSEWTCGDCFMRSKT